MNQIKFALIAALSANPALANCRIEQDHIGAGSKFMSDDGYEVRSEPDYIGGTYSHDNRGNSWTHRKSPFGGPDEVIEHPR